LHRTNKLGPFRTVQLPKLRRRKLRALQHASDKLRRSDIRS
jgi:hypothetical protein